MRRCREFSLQVRLRRAAHAGPAGIEVLAALLAVLHVAGLGHEIVDDAVEDDAVIGASRGQVP